MITRVKETAIAGAYLVERDEGAPILAVTTRSPLWREVQAFLASGGVIEPMVTLAELRKKKHDEMRQAFDAELAKGFIVTAGIKYDSDFDSVNKLDVLVKLADLAGLASVQVRDYDNITHDLTVEEFRGHLVEIGRHVQAQFAKKNLLQDAARECPTAGDLDLIQW